MAGIPQCVADFAPSAWRRLEFEGVPVCIRDMSPAWFVPNTAGDRCIAGILHGASAGDNQNAARILSRLPAGERTEWPGRGAFLGSPILREVWLHVTNRCNMACKHCLFASSPDEQTELATETALQRVREALVRSNCLLSTAENESRRSVKECYSEAAGATKDDILNPASYPPEAMRHVPERLRFRGYGCGSPAMDAEIAPGDVVVDLGCGRGVECFIAARQTGREGRVIGIDMLDSMLDVAREGAVPVARNLGYNNLIFEKGCLENLPLQADGADVVLSNCVLNLSADKRRTFREIHRVLKPGGRMVISDVVCETEPDAAIRNDETLRGECIAGAMSQRDSWIALKKAAELSPLHTSHRPARRRRCCLRTAHPERRVQQTALPRADEAGGARLALGTVSPAPGVTRTCWLSMSRTHACRRQATSDHPESARARLRLCHGCAARARPPSLSGGAGSAGTRPAGGGASSTTAAGTRPPDKNGDSHRFPRDFKQITGGAKGCARYVTGGQGVAVGSRLLVTLSLGPRGGALAERN